VTTATDVLVAFPPLMPLIYHVYPKMEVGQMLTSFVDFEKYLEDFKKQNNHPLRVFNSQTARNYNSKHPADHVDEERFSYTYYSVRCIHYGEPRHCGKEVRCHQ